MVMTPGAVPPLPINPEPLPCTIDASGRWLVDDFPPFIPSPLAPLAPIIPGLAEVRCLYRFPNGRAEYVLVVRPGYPDVLRLISATMIATDAARAEAEAEA